MERLQGPLNHSCFVGEHLEQYQQQVDLAEEKGLSLFEEELEAKMPFLQMLQSVETQQQQSIFPLKDPNFQTLLKLQHLKKTPWELDITTTNNINLCHHYFINNDMSDEFTETQIQGFDFDSCVTTTHDTVVDYSITSFHESAAVKSEAKDHHRSNQVQAQQVLDVIRSQETLKAGRLSSAQVCRDKRKRKRTKPSKNKEEVETQRMTHIAVERNRRRQMNEHLGVLRSLMPNSYIQRGDQASIVGGAIDFVKELEQLLQSLEAQKWMKRTSSTEENNNYNFSISSASNSSSSSSSSTSSSSNRLAQFRVCRVVDRAESKNSTVGDEVRAENKSESADIEVTVIQTHVNLKVQCPKRPGQLLKAIVALEDLRLTILHLNITSSHTNILYSLNLKIEDGCKLGSADEIAGAVHQIFRLIDRS